MTQSAKPRSRVLWIIIPALSGFLGTLVLLSIVCSVVWIGVAEFTVDWTKMPTEAIGDERGALGGLFKEALSRPESDWTVSYVDSSNLPLFGRVSKDQLRQATTIGAARDGDLVRLHIRVIATDQQLAKTILEDANSTMQSNFQGYRFLEGLAKIRENETSGVYREDDGLGLLQLLSMASSNPVSQTQPPTLGSALDRGFGVIVFVSLVLGCLAGGLGFVISLIVRPRPRAVISRSAIHETQPPTRLGVAPTQPPLAPPAGHPTPKAQPPPLRPLSPPATRPPEASNDEPAI